MTTILLFLTILAWMGLVLALARIGWLAFSATDNPLIRFAESLGADLIGAAILRWAFVAGVCAAWLVAYYLS